VTGRQFCTFSLITLHFSSMLSVKGDRAPRMCYQVPAVRQQEERKKESIERKGVERGQQSVPSMHKKGTGANARRPRYNGRCSGL
jgi:hypothetical protein